MGNNIGIIIALSVALPIAIILIVFIPILRRSMRSRQLLNTGMSANGTIVKVWQTGLYVNEQPEIGMTIQVMPPDRPPFQAEARKIVPMIQLAQVQPGQMVEVKYDPNDTSKVALSAILSGGMPGGMGGMQMAGMQMNAQMAALSQIPPELQQIVMQQNTLSAMLFQSGQPATARILGVRDYGAPLPDGTSPKIFSLEVQPFGQPPFQSESFALVSYASQAKYSSGAIIQVKFDPSNYSRVAIVPS
ncbi:MAG: hypothetical protein HXX08_09980 [Chloroflexi bacterium]|uniref:DUF3592 domain-containing protein n=1 Tax=Candidatus Chlorohelix allophototropha TaxID=3003348 RepID=A0A8T7M388_9CHLR|nr:hypothetical protein [Chloroflexota bacterium]WJW65573.1 hypothetical protein OZ401_001340 [Chloroflexota bacterium L227-S17]